LEYLLPHFDYKYPQSGYNNQVVAIDLCVTKIKIKIWNNKMKGQLLRFGL